MTFTRIGAAVLALALSAMAAPDARAQDPAFLAVSVGAYDINDNETAAQFGLEYRGTKMLWQFKPLAGVMATSDGAFYGYGGIGLDLFFGSRWVLTPNFAAGLYEDGDGKDLGHVVEFRSGVELAYRLDDRARIGIAFHHISNASLDDNNPGTETLVLTLAVPFDRVFGR